MLLEFWFPSKTQHKAYPFHQPWTLLPLINCTERIRSWTHATEAYWQENTKAIHPNFYFRHIPGQESFLSLSRPKNCQVQLPAVGNMLHLTVCRLSTSKLRRTWYYSTSSTYQNYWKFSTFAHQAAVKKECWAQNTSWVLNTSLFWPQRITTFIESNCSILKASR